MKSVKDDVRSAGDLWMDSYVELDVRLDVNNRLSNPISPIIAVQLSQNAFIGLLPK